MKLQVFILAAVVLVVITFFLDLRLAVPLLLLAPYWLGPITVRLTSRYSRAPQYAPLRPGIDPIPEPARIHLASVENVLRGLGFSVAGHWRQTGFAANLAAFLVLVEHPQTHVAGMGVAIAATGPGVSKLVTYTELWTRFGEERSLTTNNSPQPRVFADVPGRTIERFPNLWDVPRLVRVHEALVRRAGTAEPRRPFAERSPDRVLQEAMTREMAAQVAAGFVFVDGDHYRPTWKGAALMSWRLLWPMRSVREARLKRHAEALLAELRV
jgi:hypothetical protein